MRIAGPQLCTVTIHPHGGRKTGVDAALHVRSQAVANVQCLSNRTHDISKGHLAFAGMRRCGPFRCTSQKHSAHTQLDSNEQKHLKFSTKPRDKQAEGAYDAGQGAGSQLGRVHAAHLVWFAPRQLARAQEDSRVRLLLTPRQHLVTTRVIIESSSAAMVS